MFTAGYLNKKITLFTQSAPTVGTYGRKGGEWQEGNTYYANVQYVKGTAPMREGAVDVYSTLLIRTRYHADILPECRIKYKGKMYDIIDVNGNETEDEMQFNVGLITE